MIVTGDLDFTSVRTDREDAMGYGGNAQCSGRTCIEDAKMCVPCLASRSDVSDLQVQQWEAQLEMSIVIELYPIVHLSHLSPDRDIWCPKADH
jgi:hypothetical protein